MSLWSPLTERLSPYIPGEQSNQSNLIKLNTNENPFPPSPKAVTAMQNAINDDLRKYPAPESDDLRKVIGEQWGLNPDQVFIGNGSDEVLAFAFMGLFKHGKPILYPNITYSFYPTYCKLFEIDSETPALNSDFSINWDDYTSPLSDSIGGIIFPNPNAPTGLACSLETIEKLLKAHPNTPIVVDEAYIGFGAESAAALIQDHPNLLVVQTLSKSHSLAGLRVGFALGQSHIIEGLTRVKNSFNSYPIDRIAQAGAKAAILDVDYFNHTRSTIINTREQFCQALAERGFQTLPSQANFVFTTHPDHKADEIQAYLREHAIMVRYFDKPIINKHLRITIGTEQEMETFIKVWDQR